MTLFGWDSSDFDWARGSMDLAAAKADGLTWFTHKATEATNTKHIHLADALDRARAAGFEFLGAYHVVRSSPSVNEQMAYFLRYLDQAVPWWRAFPGFMLQVDLELWSYDQVSAATGIAFANALQAAQPKRVLTYASRGMYGNSLTGLSTPLWNANYPNGDPAGHYRDLYPGDGGVGWVPYSGQAPVMWQYGSRCTIGTQPGCDANAFRGTLADLRQLITGSTTEVDMGQQVLVSFSDAPDPAQVWLCDGMLRRRVSTADLAPGHIGNDGTHNAGMLGNLGNGGKVFISLWGGRDSWGVEYPPTGDGGASGGATKDEVAEVVRSELDATKLGRA